MSLYNMVKDAIEKFGVPLVFIFYVIVRGIGLRNEQGPVHCRGIFMKRDDHQYKLLVLMRFEPINMRNYKIFIEFSLLVKSTYITFPSQPKHFSFI